MPFVIDNEEYLNIDEVSKITGSSQASLYVKIRYNEFPKPQTKDVLISDIRKRKLWKRSEIEAYIAAKKEEREEI